jgi:hypothetical protein
MESSSIRIHPELRHAIASVIPSHGLISTMFMPQKANGPAPGRSDSQFNQAELENNRKTKERQNSMCT